jgi:hypothetical protein
VPPDERPLHLRPPNTKTTSTNVNTSPSPLSATSTRAHDDKDVDVKTSSAADNEKRLNGNGTIHDVEKAVTATDAIDLSNPEAVVSSGVAPQAPLLALPPNETAETPARLGFSLSPRALLKRRPTGSAPRAATSTTGKSNKGKEPKYDKSLLRALHATFWLRWWSAGMLSLFSNTLRTTAPLVTKELLAWLERAYAFRITGVVSNFHLI